MNLNENDGNGANRELVNNVNLNIRNDRVNINGENDRILRLPDGRADNLAMLQRAFIVNDFPPRNQLLGPLLQPPELPAPEPVAREPREPQPPALVADPLGVAEFPVAAPAPVQGEPQERGRRNRRARNAERNRAPPNPRGRGGRNDQGAPRNDPAPQPPQAVVAPPVRGGGNARGNGARQQRGRQNGPRNHGGLVQQGLVAAIQQAQGQADGAIAQLNQAQEREPPPNELELLAAAERGEILSGGDAEKVTKLIKKNKEATEALRELRHVRDVQQAQLLFGDRSQVSLDYSERNTSESIENQNYGPYEIKTKHHSRRGGLPSFVTVLLFFLVALATGITLCFSTFAGILVLNSLSVLVIITLITSLVLNRRGFKFASRKFSFVPLEMPLQVSDCRIEASRATKATLSPKLGTLTYDSWVTPDPDNIRVKYSIDLNGFHLKWMYEGSVVSHLNVGFFNFVYVDFGAAIRRNCTATFSMEKYLQLISTQNIDTNRDFATIIDIIHRKAKSMPTINLDKRLPLIQDVDQNTILAAELYAEFFIGSDVGRNLFYMKRTASPLLSSPSQ